jgi:fluoride exporter
VLFGIQLAIIILPHLPVLSPPSQSIRCVLTSVSILTYAAVFPIYFLLSVDFRHQATAALLFAFPGALTRHVLSIQLNTLLKALPLGTFTANSIGTALLGIFHVLQNKSGHPVSSNACALLQGLSDGFCGCLTTVSTFVVEIHDMKFCKGFRYALVSWTVGQLLLLVILGPSVWSGAAKKQMTCTFA